MIHGNYDIHNTMRHNEILIPIRTRKIILYQKSLYVSKKIKIFDDFRLYQFRRQQKKVYAKETSQLSESIIWPLDLTLYYQSNILNN